MWKRTCEFKSVFLQQVQEERPGGKEGDPEETAESLHSLPWLEECTAHLPSDKMSLLRGSPHHVDVSQ